MNYSINQSSIMKKSFAWMIACMCAFSYSSVAQTTKEDAIRKTLNERYESAEADLTELIAREPANGDLYHAAGDNYLYWGEIEKAEAMYRKGIEAAALNPSNYAGLGRVAWMNKNEAVNTAQFAKAVEIMTTRSNKIAKPLQQLTYLKMAEVYMQSEKKNIEKALEYINTALNLNPENPEVYIQLGDYYSERDGVNLSNAIMQYNKALEKDPKYTRALLRKGVLYVKIKAWDDGLNYYNEAITVDPTYAPAYREKAELLYQAVRYPDAIAAYAKYLELNNSCRVQQRYASFIFLTKDYKRALTELEKALPCNKENIILYRLLGYAYYETGDYAKSTEYLDKFIAMAKANGKITVIGSDYGYKGKLYAKAGQDSLAIMTIQQAIDTDPTYVDGYGEIAAIYQKQKKYDKAAEYFQMKIAKSETPAALDYYYLGTCRYFNKEYVAADSAFSKCEKKYPDATFWRGRANNRMELDLEKPLGLGKPFFEAYITSIGTDSVKVATNKKNLIESYSYLGFFHYSQANMDCAKVAYNKVVEMDALNEKANIALKDEAIMKAPGVCELMPAKP